MAEAVVASDPNPLHVHENLKPREKEALHELRARLEAAIVTNQLFNPPPTGHHQHDKRRKTRIAHVSSPTARGRAEEEGGGGENNNSGNSNTNVSLWGVPLLPSKGHKATNDVLLRFLRARDFEVDDALDMLGKTLRWRKEFDADGVLEDEELEGDEQWGACTRSYNMESRDVEGRPLFQLYEVYGVFTEDKELYSKTLGSEEGRDRFVRWRVRFMEEGVRQQLSLEQQQQQQQCTKAGDPSPPPMGGAGDTTTAAAAAATTSFIQIVDLKDSDTKTKELRNVVKTVLSIFQDNYPDFVKKTIFVNVSLRYYIYRALLSNFLSTRSRSKFVFVRPSKVTETLIKFIAPENLPIQYGGLKRENDDEFSTENVKASELLVKGGGKGTIVIPVAENGLTVVWDLAVVGWEVTYKEEFIPDDEGSYRILIQKERKIEECVRNSFYINEPGKLVLTIDNKTFQKKRVLYRSKTKATVPLYNLLCQPQQGPL